MLKKYMSLTCISCILTLGEERTECLKGFFSRRAGGCFCERVRRGGGRGLLRWQGKGVCVVVVVVVVAAGNKGG